ncbi:MAG: hypothetical protein LBK53_09400 [Heliobacteriaceae bacterium]|jgi:hypothetical protein|nr:hypothetical protein [Heliobacteriaceae bacterium]
MSISKYYKSLTIYGWQEPYFGQEGGYIPRAKFKGLIQPPAGRTFTSLTQVNSKDTANIAAILFCSEKQKFEPKDIIADVSGTKYKIFDDSNSMQKDGITGIKPKRGQHAEYKLVYFQEAI